MRDGRSRTWRKIAGTQQAGEAGSGIDIKESGRIADGGGQPPRALTIEGVHNTFAEVIEIDAISDADGALSGVTQKFVPEAGFGVRGNRRWRSEERGSCSPKPSKAACHWLVRKDRR